MLKEGANLKTNYKFPLCKTHKHMCHLSITRRCDEAAAKLISLRSIESSGDFFLLEILPNICLHELTYNKIRIEFVSNRHDNVLKGKHIVCIAHAFGGPGNVNVPALRLMEIMTRRPHL